MESGWGELGSVNLVRANQQLLDMTLTEPFSFSQNAVPGAGDLVQQLKCLPTKCEVMSSCPIPLQNQNYGYNIEIKNYSDYFFEKVITVEEALPLVFLRILSLASNTCQYLSGPSSPLSSVSAAALPLQPRCPGFQCSPRGCLTPRKSQRSPSARSRE